MLYILLNTIELNVTKHITIEIHKIYYYVTLERYTRSIINNKVTKM